MTIVKSAESKIVFKSGISLCNIKRSVVFIGFVFTKKRISVQRTNKTVFFKLFMGVFKFFLICKPEPENWCRTVHQKAIRYGTKKTLISLIIHNSQDFILGLTCVLFIKYVTLQSDYFGDELRVPTFGRVNSRAFGRARRLVNRPEPTNEMFFSSKIEKKKWTL